MKNDTKVLRYVELDINPCSRTYGAAPCTAAIPTTGDFKCYNSPRTCQDPANYLAGDVQVIRFAEPTADLPIEIECQPCITKIQRRPLKIEPGEGLGVRESVTVSMHDFKDNGILFDKYINDRGFNTYNKGTYWGKFNARWGSLKGYTFRTIDGYVGQSLSEMTTRWYTVESTQGPDSKGNFSFTVKDAMKFLDNDRAQWPKPSNGTLIAGITDVATTLTLTPTGVGNAEYPASGTASMGDEKVTFTRVGDVITLTGRGLSGSSQDSHDVGETFQLAVVFSGVDPAGIIRDILTDATDIPSAYIDYTTWKAEVDAFLGRLYSAEIMNPTSVKTLIEEIVREAGLTVFCDVNNQVIVLKVLRQELPSSAFNDDTILGGAIASKVLYDRKITDAWVHHGKKNPLEKQSETKNYAVIYAETTTNPVIALENNPSSIRDIFSRWITVFNLAAAQSVAQRLVSRYETAPRQISLKVPNIYDMKLGGYVSIQSRIFENSQGDLEDPITCQVVQLDDKDGIYSAVTEEVSFGTVIPPDPSERVVFISENTFNINLKTVHDAIYSPVASGETVRFVFNSGVIVGSNSTSTPAVTVGVWPSGVILKLDGTGRIQGRGGDGAPLDGVGGDGGPALQTSYAIEIISAMQIWSGGGGGGYFRFLASESIGAGGAGQLPGAPGGTTESGGGSGGTSAGGGPGQDGNLGQDGGVAPNTPAGSAGISITGSSFVTNTGGADIRGPVTG